MIRGCAALAALFATAALAVEPPPEPQRPPFLTPAPSFTLPAVPAAPASAPSAGDARVTLREVVISGNTVIPASDLQAVAAAFIGKPAGGAQVEELRQALTRLYVERGYISSGAVVQAVSASGAVAYRIVEGRIVAVRLRGLDGLHERYVAARLARADDGPFNVNVLRERFEMLLGDPLFKRMNARIVPGDAPGEAILDVDIERAPERHAEIYANNYRPPSIGANGVGIRGSIANLTGWGDVIDVSLEDSWQFDSGTRLHVAGRIPLNAYGTGVFAKYERDASTVLEEPLQLIDIRSRLESAEAGITQSLVENLRTRFTLALSFLARENRTSLLGEPFSFVPGEPEGRTRAGSVRFWQEYARRSEKDALVARSIFSYVHDNLQQAPDIVSPLQPDRAYHLWLGQAQYARRLSDEGAQAIFRATVQRTNAKLLPLDSLPIGGIASVRGYRENQLIRDVAQVFNADLEIPAWHDASRGAALTVIPFVDYGHGRGTGQPGTTLASFGVAGRLAWGRLNASLTYGRRLTHPAVVEASHGTLQDHGWHFELAWNLD